MKSNGVAGSLAVCVEPFGERKALQALFLTGGSRVRRLLSYLCVCSLALRRISGSQDLRVGGFLSLMGLRQW